MRKLLSAWWVIRVVSVRIVCIIVTILIIVIWIVVLIVIIRPSYFILEEEISWKRNGFSFLVLITIVDFIRTHLNFQNLILMLSPNFRQLEYLAENSPTIKIKKFHFLLHNKHFFIPQMTAKRKLIATVILSFWLPNYKYSNVYFKLKYQILYALSIVK